MKKLTVIAALLVFMTGTAYAAADWNFYGSARVSTFYTKWDGNMLDTGAGGNPIVGTGPDTSNYEMGLNGNSRIGARVKVSDTITGRFEYGAKNGSANLRILWGEWNFGAGSLGIGETYVPLINGYANQVYPIHALGNGDMNMTMFGMLYGGRRPMIKLKFGNFQIAAVQPKEVVHSYYTFRGGGAAPATSGPGTEVKLPSIQAKYKLNFDWGHINLSGGYQNFDVVDSGDEYDVTSYVLAVGSRLNVGKAYFKGNVWGGQNVGNLASIFTSQQIFSTVRGAGDDEKDGAGVGLARWSDGTLNAVNPTQPARGITDNDALAALIVAGYEIRKGLSLEAGYGYTQTELDASGEEKQYANTWYANSTIFLAEGVFITPEVGGCQTKGDGMDLFYFGAKWQVNF